MDLSLCGLGCVKCRSYCRGGERGEGLYLIMWDKRVLEKLKDMVGTFSVLVRWQEVAVGFIWVCSRVYGPNENSDKGHMWDELVGIE